MSKNNNLNRVLMVQQMIPHYRIPIFNRLSQLVDLTVAADQYDKDLSYEFKINKIDIFSIGPFVKIKNLSKLQISHFDALIITFNIRYIDLFWLLFFRNKSTKLIVWGIGVSSEQGYDRKTKFDKIRYWIAKKADAVVFYSSNPIDKYVKKGGVPRSKLFVANNTISLKSFLFKDKKKYFLFVGTLKKYKKINELILLFNDAYLEYPEILDLHIVGDGDYMKSLIDQIGELGLSKKIVLHGSITNEKQLAEIYRYAIASISPFQAGLSVLQSMSMGVPFMTLKDSITGGERFNIKDCENGFLVEDEVKFVSLLLDLSKNPENFESLGENAFNYFNEHCSVESMVSGFEKALLQ